MNELDELRLLRLYRMLNNGTIEEAIEFICNNVSCQSARIEFDGNILVFDPGQEHGRFLSDDDMLKLYYVAMADEASRIHGIFPPQYTDWPYPI